MENFEEHIRKNKSKLELDQVNPDLWLSIENEVLKKKNRVIRRYLKLVSSAAAVLIIGMLSWYGFNQNDNQNIHAKLIERYGLQEHQFPQAVTNKKESLANAKIPADRKEDFEILLKQLEFLDEQYHDYIKYIEVNDYQEFIGKQILNYYRNKIELLDKIQSEIKKIEEYESKYKTSSPKVKLSI